MARISMEEMRQTVSNMYSGPKWKKKVHVMPDGQIFAIYQREARKREEVEAKARADKRRAERGQTPANDNIPF